MRLGPQYWAATDVEALDLTERAYNCLRRARITSLGELVKKTADDLLSIRAMGRTTVRVIEKALAARGLHLGMQKVDLRTCHSVDAFVRSDSQSATHWAATDVEALDLTERAYNCLRRARITSLGELVKKTADDLLSIRAMGRTTVRVIEKALATRGLHLGMQEIDLRTCHSVDAFLHAMDVVRDHGTTSVADLVTTTPQELMTLPGVDATTVRQIEAGLAKWGLSLGVLSARERFSEHALRNGLTEEESASGAREAVINSASAREVAESDDDVRSVADERATDHTPEEGDMQSDHSQTVKAELPHAIEHLLGDRGSSRFRCFAAYHGIDGRTRPTLQEIGDQGAEYGFSAPVTRERVRQVVVGAERTLRRGATRIALAHWTQAVLDAQEHVPATVDRVIDTFGYRSCDEPRDVFSMLRLVADIFSLEFPFDVQTFRDTDVVTDRTAACVETMDIVRRLTTSDNDAYYGTAATAKTVDCEPAVLEAVVGGPFGWEFLDEAHRYFWTTPRLPPRNYAITGNAILTGLCKVYSVAREAATVDLAQAVSRQRGVRRAVPREVVEGVATRSGLFDSEEGVVMKKEGQAWFCLGERDLLLLQVFVEHGRVVSSQTLQSSLVRYGLTSENAAITIAYSPFLVHTKTGMFRDEGLYKLVCRPDDVVMALKEGGRQGGVRPEEPRPHTEGVKGIVRIPLSPRVRLSGSHFAPVPLEMDGDWRVRGVDGTVIGAVTLSGHLVEGLCPVIDALGLEENAVLELRRHDGDLLAVCE